MNVNPFKLTVTVLLSILIAYLYWTICPDVATIEEKCLIAFSGFISSLLSLGGALALEYKNCKYAVNAKILSWLFVVTFIVQHLIIALFSVNYSSIIITTGILILIYVLLLHGLIRIKL